MSSLFLALTVVLVLLANVVSAQIVQITVTANDRPYTIELDLKSATLVETAEQFCKAKRDILGLDTFDKLVLGCISSATTAIRDSLATSNIQAIPHGEMSQELRNILKERELAEAKATKRAIEIRIEVNNIPYVLAVDAVTFKSINTAEFFCRQKANELGITNVAELVDNCIPPVIKVIKDELAKTYNVASIADGELGQEAAAYVADKQAKAAAAAANQAAQRIAAAPVVNKHEFTVAITANEKPYNLVLNLDSFTVLSSAEDFCLQRASELGISSIDALVNRCLIVVADVIRNDLAKTYRPESIPMGSVVSLTPEVRNYVESFNAATAKASADAAAAAAATAVPIKTDFEFVIPIEDRSPITVSFDLRRATPMSAAETVCDSAILGLTDLESIFSCVPQVAAYIKRVVDSEIAPRTVEIGTNTLNYQTLFKNSQARKQ